MAGLRRLADVLTPEEQVPTAPNEEYRQFVSGTEGMGGDFGRRWTSGLLGSAGAAPLSFAGTGLRALGYQDAARPLLDKSAELRQRAADAAVGSIQEVTDIGSVKDALRYGAGAVGNAAASYAPALAVGLATRSPRLGLATMFPMEAGETTMSEEAQNVDPGTAFQTAVAKGAVNTALESVPFMNIFGRGPLRTLGRGAGLPMRAAQHMGAEGITEGVQEVTGQEARSFLDPNRDTSNDLRDIRESVIQGAVGSAPFAGVAAVSGAAQDMPQRLPIKMGDGTRAQDILDTFKSPVQKARDFAEGMKGKSVSEIIDSLRNPEEKKFSKMFTGIASAEEDLSERDSYLINAIGKDRFVNLSNQIDVRALAQEIDAYVRGEGKFGIRNNPGMTPDVDPFRAAVADLLGGGKKPDFEAADALFEHYASAVPSNEKTPELWQGDKGVVSRTVTEEDSGVDGVDEASPDPTKEYDPTKGYDESPTQGETAPSISYHFREAKAGLPFAGKPPPSAYKALRDSGVLKSDPTDKRARNYKPQSMLEYALENGLDPEQELERVRSELASAGTSGYEGRIKRLREAWKRLSTDKTVAGAKQRDALQREADQLKRLWETLNMDTSPDEKLAGLYILRTEALPGDELTASDRDIEQYGRQPYGRADSKSTIKFWKDGKPITLNASQIIAAEKRRDTEADMKLNAKNEEYRPYLKTMLEEGIRRVMNRGYSLNAPEIENTYGRSVVRGRRNRNPDNRSTEDIPALNAKKGDTFAPHREDPLGLRPDVVVWRDPDTKKDITYGELVESSKKYLTKFNPDKAVLLEPQSEITAGLLEDNDGELTVTEMQALLRDYAAMSQEDAAAALEAADAEAFAYEAPIVALEKRLKESSLPPDTPEYKAMEQHLRALKHGRGSYRALVGELKGGVFEDSLGMGATSTQEISEIQQINEKASPKPRFVQEETSLNLASVRRQRGGTEKVPSAPKETASNATGRRYKPSAERQKLLDRAERADALEATKQPKVEPKAAPKAEPKAEPKLEGDALYTHLKAQADKGVEGYQGKDPSLDTAKKQAEWAKRQLERLTALRKKDQDNPLLDEATWALEELRDIASFYVEEREAAAPPKVRLTGSSPYLAKDQAKSDKATKFIGRGSPKSSTAAYAAAWGERANSGKYTKSDRVFVSAEGNRAGRLTPDFVELRRAVEAGATIITDTPEHRSRPYNVGERAVAAALVADGYVETKPGEWTPGKSLNRQTFTAAAKNLSKEERDQIRAEVYRLLGDKILVRFRKALDIGGAGAFSKTKLGNKLIELAGDISFSDAMSTAHHEALHAFVSLLNDPSATQEMRRAYGSLVKVAQSAAVQRKLKEAMKKYPEAYAEMKNNPEEAVAYMFQFWRAGVITNQDISPAARNWFEKLVKAIREVFGLVTHNEKAMALVRSFNAGKFAGADVSLAGAIIRDMKLETLGQRLERLTGPAWRLGEAMFRAATDRLRETDIPALGELADMYHKETDREHGRLGFLQKRGHMHNKWSARQKEVLQGASQEELQRALKTLQSREDSDDPLVKGIRAFLDDIYDYLSESGVEETVLEYGEVKDDRGHVRWVGNLARVPLRKVSSNYFPRQWDRDLIEKNQEEFRALVKKHSGWDDMRINRLVDDLMNDDQIPIQDEAAYTPYMQSAANIKLDFIKKSNAAEFAKFQNQDLVNVLTLYTYQAVHRAEYTKAFGPRGERIDAKLAKAAMQGATKEQLEMAQSAVAAMNGTLKHDVLSRDTRDLMQTVMAYENVVLLPMVLLNNFMDVIGIAIRSGDMNDAWAAFKRGVRDIVRDVRGLPRTEQEAFAELIGLIDDNAEMSNYGMAYDGVYIGGFAKRVNDRFFKWTGMHSWNRSMRTAGMIAANAFIRKHYTNVLEKKDPDGNSARYLEELGLTMKDVKFDRPGTKDARVLLTEDQWADQLGKDVKDPEVVARANKMQEAVFRFVDGAAIRPHAGHRPIWGSDPRFMLIFHLKQFTYSFQQVFMKFVAKEADYGNTVPAAIMLSLLPFSLATATIKALLLGRPIDTSFAGVVGTMIQNSAVFGTAGFGIDAVEDLNRNGVPGQSFIGPTGGHMLQAMQTLAGSPQDSWSSLLLRSVPGSPIAKAVAQ